MAGIKIATRRRSIKLGYQEGKPTVYKLQKLIYSKVSDEQLVEEIARTMGITKAQAKASFEAMVDRVCHYLELGHQVSVGKLGSFAPGFRAGCVKTEEEIGDPDNRDRVVKGVYVKFTPHKALRELIANASVTENTQAMASYVDDPTRG